MLNISYVQLLLPRKGEHLRLEGWALFRGEDVWVWDGDST